MLENPGKLTYWTLSAGMRGATTEDGKNRACATYQPDHPEIAEEIAELMKLFECNGMGQETEGEFRLH